MLVFFMFRTKANGFQVMDIGHYCGLIIIGLSFRLTVYRGLIASMGPIWRICYLIVLCFVFGCLSVFVCLANSPTPQQWMLWSFFIFTLSRKMWRIVLCSAIVVFDFYQHGCEVLLVFLKSTISCKRSVAWFGLKLPVYSTTGDRMFFLIFPSPIPQSGGWDRGGSLFILPPIIFFIFHHRPFIFFGPSWWKLWTSGIYAFTHTPELFKCEALLAMP